MKYFVVAAALAVPAATAQDLPSAVVVGAAPFTSGVLADGLDNPWEITYGPDDRLWVTERTARRITRVDPQTGTKTPAATIDAAAVLGGQDGLLGLALHPELLTGTGHDFVYVSYTYLDESRPNNGVADPANPYRHLRLQVARLAFDAATGTLGAPETLIDGLPASNDHNSGRLKFGPDRHLYLAIGDGGMNQFGNACRPIEAQRLPSADEIAAGNYGAYAGKVLRLGLDGAVPPDNPELDGVRSHIFTYGHRNPQGLAFALDGRLYAAEHGPKTDDEVNRLTAGENYGWPHVAGFADDMAYDYARWADAPDCRHLEFSDLVVPASVPRTAESAWTTDFVAPVATLFTVPSDWNFSDAKCGGMDFICWPTVATSSLEVYEAAAVPGWEDSLLVTTLKRGSLYRLPLAATAAELAGPIERYFQSEDRFRDLAVAPDGTTIYIATDSGGIVEALAGGVTMQLRHPGAILRFSYARP